MEYKENKFDEMYRKQLEEFKLPVSDNVFANIKSQVELAKPKNKFGYGFWISYVSIIIGLVVMGYFMINKDNTRGKQELSIQDSKKLNTSSQNINMSSQNTNTSSQNMNMSSQNTNTNSQSTNTSSQNINMSSQNINTNSQSSNVSAINNEITSLGKKPDEKIDSMKLSIKDNINDSSVLSSSIEKKTEEKKEEVRTIDLKEVKTEAQKDSIQNASLAKADSIKQNKQASPIDDNKLKQEKNNVRFIGINGGTSIAFRTLNVGNNTGAENRMQNEKSIVTYNAGLDFGLIKKNKLIFSAGIHMTNLGEKYNFNNTSVKATSKDSTYSDTMGVHTIIQTVNTTVKSEFSRQNNYQFWGIPILIGYKFNLTDKLFVAPCISINFNYLLKGSSTWFDTNTIQQIDYITTNDFNRLSLSGTFKLDLGLTIKDKWSVILQPEYTRWFQSIYKKGDEIKLYPYSYTINVGVRYMF